MRTFIQGGRALSVAAMLPIVALLLFVGCGGVDKELVGYWVFEDGSQGMVLNEDGRGIFMGQPMNWGVVGNILMMTDPMRGEDISFQYKLSGYVVTLTREDGSFAKFVREEKFKEYRKQKSGESSGSSNN